MGIYVFLFLEFFQFSGGFIYTKNNGTANVQLHVCENAHMQTRGHIHYVVPLNLNGLSEVIALSPHVYNSMFIFPRDVTLRCHS